MDAAWRERYSRQILFPGIGETGQEALLASHAAIVGCGALGSGTVRAASSKSVRAGCNPAACRREDAL